MLFRYEQHRSSYDMMTKNICICLQLMRWFPLKVDDRGKSALSDMVGSSLILLKSLSLIIYYHE